jgi:hypothetical protein
MENASRDENNVTTILGTSDADGLSTIKIVADPVTHILQTNDGVSGVDLGPVNAPRDSNYVTALIATSYEDGVTPVVLYADSNGYLLTNTNDPI